ncbi:MAG: hypothetical protein U0992_22805 [Planctomycetaceae bacterium]
MSRATAGPLAPFQHQKAGVEPQIAFASVAAVTLVTAFDEQRPDLFLEKLVVCKCGVGSSGETEDEQAA